MTMFPDKPQNHLGQPVSLPTVDTPSQPTNLLVSPDTPQAVPPGDAILHAALQAKQLAAQYANDPFRLSEALGELRAKYLVEQYQITSSRAEP
jgi:hypothetical protein